MDFYLEKTDAVIRSKFVDKLKFAEKLIAKKKQVLQKTLLSL